MNTNQTHTDEPDFDSIPEALFEPEDLDEDGELRWTSEFPKGWV